MLISGHGVASEFHSASGGVGPLKTNHKQSPYCNEGTARVERQTVLKLPTERLRVTNVGSRGKEVAFPRMSRFQATSVATIHPPRKTLKITALNLIHHATRSDVSRGKIAHRVGNFGER